MYSFNAGGRHEDRDGGALSLSFLYLLSLELSWNGDAIEDVKSSKASGVFGNLRAPIYSGLVTWSVWMMRDF